MGKRNPYAGSLAQGQHRQRVVCKPDRQELRAQINAAFNDTFAYLADTERADAYRRLIASYMVETIPPDPAPVGDVWIMDPDEAFAMSLRPILERLADDAPAQEESWQEPLRQPDDD